MEPTPLTTEQAEEVLNERKIPVGQAAADVAAEIKDRGFRFERVGKGEGW